MKRPIAIVASAFAAASILACGAISPRSSEFSAGRAAAPGLAAQDERKVVKRADLDLEVGSLEAARAEVERLVADADGLVESSTSVEDERVILRCRVPSDRLEAVMDRIAALGDLTRRSLSKEDVTDRWFDLEARLRNAIALRDRLRALLDRATSVTEVVAVEKELTRVQTEVETLQAQFDRLRGQVSLSALDVTLERGRVLGPLGYVGYGLWWVVRKLFVLS
jgi:hypothetical protein